MDYQVHKSINPLKQSRFAVELYLTYQRPHKMFKGIVPLLSDTITLKPFV